jgi:hypothetical protein
MEANAAGQCCKTNAAGQTESFLAFQQLDKFDWTSLLSHRLVDKEPTP